MASRERFRLHDAAERYVDDRDGFIKWMVEFFDQHERYAIEKFKAIEIDAALAIIDRSCDARLKMLEYYDTGADYPVDKTAAAITAAILDNAYGNDKPQRLSN